MGHMELRKVVVSAMLYLLLISAGRNNACCQESFKVRTRFDFYSIEQNGELLVHVPPGLRSGPLNIIIRSASGRLGEWHGVPGNELVRIGFSIPAKEKTGKIMTDITDGSGKLYTAGCDIVILEHKSNEVKTDRLTCSLIVNGRQFFPFGFYCYSPVYPTLPEEEVVKGFNMISPYQRILPSTFNERKAYMDRCASLGMKVHYNLLSVSGGGGVALKDDTLSPAKKREYLISEVRAFMNHPALLAWYIADEPTGNNVKPEEVEELYRVVRSIDPWHPVSVVFMAPFLSASKYSGGTDIVMADPYPVPDSPISVVGDVTASLRREFAENKPVWIVPQAFGGGEIWSREPSANEIRSMTWQAIIKGATGIQYFIRSGPTSFPKSTATWNECGRIALEVAGIIPWLFSDEVPPGVISDSKNILVTSRLLKGELIIMAVNRSNDPQRVRFSMSQGYNGKAREIFENRDVNVSHGVITDYIAALGTLVYKIDLKKAREIFMPWNENLVTDPGFECVTSPSTPTSCYVSSGGDRGATFFLDPREHIEGNYSLRLQTPAEGKSMSIKLYPVKVSNGSTYIVSVWAKCDPELRFICPPFANPEGQSERQYAEVSLGDFGTARFYPDSEWRQFIGIFKVPDDSVQRKKTNIILRMPGQGTGWFDLVQMVEDPLKK